MLEQEAHNVRLASFRCGLKRGAMSIILQVDIGAAGKQEAHNLAVASPGRGLQCSAPFALEVEISAALRQEVYNVEVASLGGEHQCTSPRLLTDYVDVGMVCEQSPDPLYITFLAAEM
jgi:hypothetical protein